MIQKSQACNKTGGSTNSTFLALIPKEKGASSFDCFRPISLCNIGYKIITKFMANRLKNILPGIILDIKEASSKEETSTTTSSLSRRSSTLVKPGRKNAWLLNWTWQVPLIG
jgi:hypothetical protein